ncbi:hypothetical protein [Agarilytica rhodophyticola]|uniref:hypothetical protein n=1 Tax=Agarilytica rhodophyticola TaxID=1737490 RepID=UPI000B346FDF|nr:hypothetical protein [Agarilytica rhodophyticola]
MIEQLEQLEKLRADLFEIFKKEWVKPGHGLSRVYSKAHDAIDKYISETRGRENANSSSKK